MINIVTSFYIAKKQNIEVVNRTEELISALRNNLLSQFVQQIHLFIDDNESFLRIKTLFSEFINNGKIYIIEIGKKPLYSDLFKYAIENLTNKICFVTNSDIYIENCDFQILKMFIIIT
jgi:DNA repair protein RadC